MHIGLRGSQHKANWSRDYAACSAARRRSTRSLLLVRLTRKGRRRWPAKVVVHDQRMLPAPRNLLLTGPSGVGKSTVLRDLSRSLTHLVVRGFVSEVICAGEQRLGWRLDGLSGGGGVFIHRDLQSPHRLGPYGVDLSVLDDLTQIELVDAEGIDVYLIDEIGRACPMLPRFVESVTALLDSPHTTVSIVHPTAAGFAERVRKRNDVELWTVTTANRDSLAETIVRWGGW